LFAPRTPKSTSAATTSASTPAGPLTLQAAIAWATAAAKDADTFAATVKADIATAQSQAASTADFAKITLAAPFADQVVAAAASADTFATAAKAETDALAAEADAKKAAEQAELAHKAMTNFLDDRVVNSKGCLVTSLDSKGKPGYTFKTWLPLVGRGCNDDAALGYYNVSKTLGVANQAQYLYNAAQSTNQVNADLLTTTFSGGFQVVLAGTATAGSSQPATAASSTTTPTGSTDSVSTAVAKLEQGGDFNLRIAYPLANKANSRGGFTLSAVPNLGFSINGLSSQSTITESTDYSGNIPLEFYGEFGSIPASGTAAILYVDAKAGGEFLTSDLASKIGTSSAFFLGQISAGIEFQRSVRVGFQYYLGPKQAYCVPNSATPGCTSVTASMSGVHLVVSFTPPQ
jgi:hypothetical protein